MVDTASAQEQDALVWLRPLLVDVFRIDDITTGLGNGETLQLRGHLEIPAAEAFRRLSPSFEQHRRTLIMRRQQDRDILISLAWVAQPAGDKRWLVLLLGLLTMVSVLVTYMLNYVMTEISWASFSRGLGQGLQFTVALLTILVSHELGHYYVARHYRVPVSLPYLIPLPLSPFGTMGAVIRMKGIPPSRRAMLLTGAAGPIAGLVAALPILLVGLILSEVRPLPLTGGYMIEGNSLLYAGLKYVIHGQWLPSATHDLFMHPLAFAGWAGLLVTGFNLIPAGQLDGGHVASAWLGHKARFVTWGVIAGLLAMGLLWQGWVLWALLVLFLSRGQQEPLENITPLSPREIALAVIMFVLFVLTITPVPLRYIN